MEFSVLGPVRGWHEQRPVQLGGRQRRCLLAVLLLQAGQVVPLDRMVELIWGEHPPSSVHNAVQTHVSRLRKALTVDRELSIEAHSPGYVLRAPLDRIDLHRFRGLVAKASRTEDVERSGELLREALAQWHGRPLADVLASDSLARLSAGIEEEWLTAVQQRLRVDLRLGRHAAVVDELGSLVTSYPMREDLVELWVLALYRCGRQADALGELQLLRARMVDELGIEPGAALQTLQQRILRADPALDLRGPPVSAQPLVPAQLPADVPGFLGRTAELAALDALLLDGARIAAVSGTAGVGKTALAVHWAHRARPAFPDGQLYLDLRGYDPRQPMAAGEALARLLEAIGVPGQAVPPDPDARAARYRSEIADRRMLVLLDNASSVDQVRDLLPGTASCAVVVTSRDHLAGLVALHGARRLDLEPLPMDDAVTLLRQLIGDRAAADPVAARLLATQCAQLPLALRVTAELAVSRPETSLARLADELRDGRRRLRLLDGGGHDRAAVRAVFSWSYRHLPRDAARLFRRLSCHPGPDFDVRAAAAVGQLDLDDAGRLLGVLLRANVVQSGTHGRYGMHDLLRAYAVELAAADDSADLRATRSRLFDYYVAAAAAATDVLYPVGRPRRHDPGVPAALLPPAESSTQWLNAERANLVAVCRSAAEHAVRLSAVLYRHLEGGGHYTDALAIHGAALTAATRTGDRSGQAHAHTNLGMVHRLLGRYDEATDHLRRALELHRQTGDREGEARTSSNLGIVADRLGDVPAATDRLRQALVIYRELDNKHGTAAVLTNLGGVHNGVGEHKEAAAALAEALELFRELGDRSGEASALVNLGEAESRLGNNQPAVGHYAVALELFRGMNHRYGQAIALSNLGAAYSRLGQHDLSVTRFGEALALFRDTGHRYGEASALNGLGEALYAAGHPSALAKHTAALAIATETGDLDEQARAHTGAARALERGGSPPQARDHWRQALRLYTELGAPEAEMVREQLGGGQG